MLNWAVFIPLHLYIKPSFEEVLQMENEELLLSFSAFYFLHKAELAVIPTRSKKNKTEQHLGHFPTKKNKQNKRP